VDLLRARRVGVSAGDPLAHLGVTLRVLCLAAIAALRPALRVARVDPADALRGASARRGRGPGRREASWRRTYPRLMKRVAAHVASTATCATASSFARVAASQPRSRLRSVSTLDDCFG
jgi:hypothetical protein